jgi:glycosyltransferase involved in cell wall biosynthesis
MRVAFYAPLKPPDHAVPSGDRQLAGALLAALRVAGHRPEIASRFRSYDGRGDAARQLRLRDVGERLAERLVARIRRGAARPDLWFTYHLYHKAPDHLGPAVSRALGIPYVVAEPSVAPKQRDGRWAAGYAAALAAIRAADAAICVNPADLPQVRAARGGTGTDLLPPFIDVASFVGAAPPSAGADAPDRARVRLVTVAMMREGAKLASYRLLATALDRLTDLPWDLTIVGDGPARGAVETAFGGLAPGRARLVGQRPAGEVATLLRASDLFVWPAIDESFGMALLEAQAVGVPVLAGDTGGVSTVVAAGRTGLLVPVGDADAFAAAARRLLLDAGLRRRMGRAAVDYVRATHDLPAAGAALDVLLRGAVSARAARLGSAPFPA